MDRPAAARAASMTRAVPPSSSLDRPRAGPGTSGSSCSGKRKPSVRTPSTTVSIGISDTWSPGDPRTTRESGPSSRPARRMIDGGATIATSDPSSIGWARSSRFARSCSTRAPPSAPTIRMTVAPRATAARRPSSVSLSSLSVDASSSGTPRPPAEPACPGPHGIAVTHHQVGRDPRVERPPRAAIGRDDEHGSVGWCRGHHIRERHRASPRARRHHPRR